MIEQIIEAGYAYVSNGSVYFNVHKYAANHPYGKLSGRVIDELLQNTRELDGQEEKQNPADFALWKSAPPEHIMRWKSPWGEGFPGWHIECSAMSAKYLGHQFDIHGGGMDLLFPHHESEIAQSTICHHQAPVRYWMHNNMITINGKKMGKSYNNVIKLTEMFSGSHPLLIQPYHPMTIRFFILQSHYRSPVDFSNEALQGSEKAFRRLWDSYEALKQFPVDRQLVAADPSLDQQINRWMDEFEPFLDDDFSTAKVIANLFEIIPSVNAIKNGNMPLGNLSGNTVGRMQEQFKIVLEDIFGLQSTNAGNATALSGLIELIIELRNEAKNRKDYAASDAIRKKLGELGISLKDEKDGRVSWGQT
jgi:cysteinyl-tRNA synthetase